MNIGKDNNDGEYTIENEDSQRTLLIHTTSECGSGIEIINDLKLHSQVCKASSTANKVIGILKNSFSSRDPILWKRLYTIYVRPHLEYAVSAWNPYSKKDSDILEKIQRRKIQKKVSHLLRKLSYKERLINLNLTTLSARRERGDLIQQFKIEKKSTM